jgi:hypothetical protein
LVFAASLGSHGGRVSVGFYRSGAREMFHHEGGNGLRKPTQWSV